MFTASTEWDSVTTIVSVLFTISPQSASRGLKLQNVFFSIFMHLADAFIQSDLQYIQAIHVYVCSLGIEPTTFCAANAMLYH